MGEEKKEEGKKEEKKEEKEEEKKGEEEEDKASIEIVVKVDMHCEACARKVARSLKGFQGVEEVRTDCKASKVVVKAEKAADPIKVCERIQKKSGRKAELISPLPNPNPPSDDTNNKQENKETPPPEEKKQEEPPAVVTVILKVQMHCEACAQVLQKRIKKIKGVETVTTDLGKNQVIVKGTVDPEKLVSDVYKRTRKQASIVKEEEKKAEEEKKEEDKKEEEKKEEKKEGGGEEKKEGEEGGDDKLKSEIKKSEYWPTSKYYMEYSYPPQFFSDENPNACSLM